MHCELSIHCTLQPAQTIMPPVKDEQRRKEEILLCADIMNRLTLYDGTSCSYDQYLTMAGQLPWDDADLPSLRAPYSHAKIFLNGSQIIKICGIKLDSTKYDQNVC